ncbi:non-canonical purine NTP pyrophosphatase [Pedobacter frigidisoli]|uniref:non-canonical purine NTP pyrophosphatase n=1 Tax=Pedobacter frigidisoli TaxID=2530455 RepID=UPI00292D0459|nr:non-canonical purine NTP pyrophosphatase [Pedobacter frigidisoli]
MLELTFITSSKEKISHAIYLSRDYPVRISKQKNYGIGYVEPRIGSREELIKRSVEDAILRFEKTTKNANEKFFIIEDTSVIIDELSKKAEYPGVDVKYWMRENNFLSIDKMLKKAGNNRAVTVRSDVILVLNKSLSDKFKKKYLSFTSFSKGHIVEKEVYIKTQPLYPWLNNRTFNKWFVPNGENVPMSKLPISKADKYDFRAGAFKELYTFLKTQNYLKADTFNEQLELFEPVAFIICGPSCAGKTTLSSFLQDKYNYYHFEASDFMYLSYYDTHGVKSNVPIGDFAEDALKKNPTIVTNQILRYLRQFKHIPILVTGFRSHLEVDQFLKKYRGGLNIEVIYVESDEKIRFVRNLERNRADVVNSIENFQRKDLQQFKMGLTIIKERFEQGVLENNESLNELYELFESKYQNQLLGGLMNYNKKLPEAFKRRSLENVVIQVLYDNTLKSYTTTEISHLIKKSQISLPKSKNNISRYFNQNFHPFYEISVNADGKITYRLSQTGKSYGKWINRNLSL